MPPSLLAGASTVPPLSPSGALDTVSLASPPTRCRILTSQLVRYGRQFQHSRVNQLTRVCFGFNLRVQPITRKKVWFGLDEKRMWFGLGWVVEREL
jgi:hypothetical protein